MSSALKGAGEAIWGLVVEDGSLAIGIVVALGLTWLLAAAGGDTVIDWVGWGLLAMLLALVLANLYRAGRKAAGGAARQ